MTVIFQNQSNLVSTTSCCLGTFVTLTLHLIVINMSTSRKEGLVEFEWPWDVPEKDTPAILVDIVFRRNEMLQVVEGLYKRAVGNGRSIPVVIAKIIADKIATPLKATSISNTAHIYWSQRELFVWFRNFWGRVHFDEGLGRDQHYKGYIALDTNICELFDDGVKSISIRPAFIRCDKLKETKYWFELGVAVCPKKSDIDAVLGYGNAMGKQSLKALIRTLNNPMLEGDFQIADGGIPVISWMGLKMGVSGSDGKVYTGFDGTKFVKYPSIDRDLTNAEQSGQFSSILIQKLDNGKIMIDDLTVLTTDDSKKNTPNKPKVEKNKNGLFIVLSTDKCSCKGYGKASGIVFQFWCNY